jgi:hypothetical protein
MPGLTEAVGGVWDRASDPSVAFGADGSVYVSALVYDIIGCSIGITVSRSTDGGTTFRPPVLAHKSTTCTVTDDKDWLVADTQPRSPFNGRIYQFWTEFLSTPSGRLIGSPQVVRWSDDQGRHWSATHLVSPSNENSQNSQPVIGPGGTITDISMSSRHPFADGSRHLSGEHHSGHQAASSGVNLLARTSTDGGATWSSPALIARNVGDGPAGIRCCFPLAGVDRATGQFYAVWNANGPGTLDPVMLSSSADGRHWSRPVQVTPGGKPGHPVHQRGGRRYRRPGVRHLRRPRYRCRRRPLRPAGVHLVRQRRCHVRHPGRAGTAVEPDVRGGRQGQVPRRLHRPVGHAEPADSGVVCLVQAAQPGLRPPPDAVRGGDPPVSERARP